MNTIEKCYIFFFLRPCSNLRKECMSSCLKIVWHRAAVWISSYSPASTWTWQPWLMCPHTPEAPSTSTPTSRYNSRQAYLFTVCVVYSKHTKRCCKETHKVYRYLHNTEHTAPVYHVYVDQSQSVSFIRWTRVCQPGRLTVNRAASVVHCSVFPMQHEFESIKLTYLLNTSRTFSWLHSYFY